ncbi:lysine 2,3-aminomutase [uncultured Sunxiuqinia sp.]|uniref:KamA family radical SAM protein n=1 Tax=uncultured Sunxiuqinia sp. TaxID=1573825 RepID=UPI0030D732C2|tara:strand:+ start:28908 stop:30206 length:1299 start_codon:yes stop_codon:yes gene_type:complete
MNYRSYTLGNFRQIPQIAVLSEEEQFVIEVIGTVLPFKVSNYIVDELIDWNNFAKDPFFILNFPQKGMLSEEHFQKIAKLLKSNADKATLKKAVDKIRMQLNPNPAGQEANVPELNGVRLNGIQHKYRETMLFFPSQGQTCHAYCTFCFRWPQFAMNSFKFAMKEADLMIQYLKAHPEITDVLITGGDPAVMKTKFFEHYINAILDAGLKHVRTIRIGTKALSYWPYRFTTDDDAEDLMKLFRKVADHGISVSLMAHFNHPRAMETEAVKAAIRNLQAAGVQIRSQSPLLKNINNDPAIWSTMWREQVNLGIIPYYMFIARDTGAQDYFAVTLDQAWRIYQKAIQKVSGVCRTVRGPSMSCAPGKVQVLGIQKIHGEQVFVLNFLQGRNPDWVGRPFFAKYNPKAIWLNDLEPAFGQEEFFFENANPKLQIV